MGLLSALLCSFFILSVKAQQTVYGQCGGQGWTGPTTCVSGSVCTYSNPYYSQCIPGTSTGTTVTTSKSTTTSTATTSKSTTTSTKTTSTSSSTASGSLPTSFSWSSSGILVSPKSDSRNIAGVKDPSIVYYNGHYHVFVSTVSAAAGYSMAYLNFTDFSQASNAPLFYLDQSNIGTGYRAAPQIFYFTPQKLWYLVFEDGNVGYSTNTNISNPAGWSVVKNFYSTLPAEIQNNQGSGGWVDMWVICDSSNCYMFSSDDNGHLYHAQTSLSNFPNGMSEPVIAMQDTSNIYALFEASNVYRVNNEYLLIVEAIGSDGHRYFRSWTSPTLSGNWTSLANTESNPFARSTNVAFSGTPWTIDISHGEMIRSGYDQTLTISPCGLRYLYQGDNPNANTSDYNAIQWRLGLLTQTNSAC